MDPALRAYESGQINATDAWEQFLKDAPVQGAF